MGEIIRNKKWQFLYLILAMALITSVSFSVVQILSAPHGSHASKESASWGSPLQGSSSSSEVNFTFIWGPNSQKIVQWTLRLELYITIDGENLSITIGINDDDYSQSDYVGLVFDTNQNGYIDFHDKSYALFADNKTMPSVLRPDGCLCFAYCPPEFSYQEVSFNPDKGYLFIIKFPCKDVYHSPWNPIHSLKKEGENHLHICFEDESSEGIFIEFSFFLPAGKGVEEE